MAELNYKLHFPDTQPQGTPQFSIRGTASTPKYTPTTTEHWCQQRSGERNQNDASAPQRGPQDARTPLPLGRVDRREKNLCLLFSLY